MPDESNLLLCPRCGDANAPEALVCSGCGARLPERHESAPPLPVVEQAMDHVEETAEVTTETPSEEIHEDAAREIDARRAQHLLERGFVLAERHEFEAAVLACRQSLALAPDVALGSALLGLLLKRQGDAQGAATAYAKAEELVTGKGWEQISFDALHTAFSEDTTALPATPKENVVLPAHSLETETSAVAKAPGNLQKEAPKPIESESHTAQKPAAWEETVSPARDKSWMAYAAVGAAILVGLVWLYKSFAPPVPTARDTAQAVQVIGDTPAPSDGAQQPSAEGSNQLTPTPNSGNQLQPPPPVGRDNGSLSPVPPVRQAAPPARQSGGQPLAETRPAQPSAAAPVTNTPSSSEAARDSGAAVPTAPYAAQVPSQASGAISSGSGGQSGGSSVSVPPTHIPPPMSSGNARPGTPHNSIPGAFQPGKP